MQSHLSDYSTIYSKNDGNNVSTLRSYFEEPLKLFKVFSSKPVTCTIVCMHQHVIQYTFYNCIFYFCKWLEMVIVKLVIIIFVHWLFDLTYLNHHLPFLFTVPNCKGVNRQCALRAFVFKINGCQAYSYLVFTWNKPIQRHLCLIWPGLHFHTQD